MQHNWKQMQDDFLKFCVFYICSNSNIFYTFSFNKILHIQHTIGHYPPLQETVKFTCDGL